MPLKTPRWSRTVLFLLLLLAALNPAGADERKSFVLERGWRFWKEGEAATPTDVVVPHTYNALDGQNGLAPEPQYPEGYYRGPAWYERGLPEIVSAKGRRVWVRFEAAALAAEVWVNGERAGAHRGGFAAFAFDVTGLLRFDGKDVLRVKVDNSRQADLAPLSGDFTIFGGLYRPVTVFVTDDVAVSLADHGTFGVYLRQESLSDSEGVLRPRVVLSNSRHEKVDTEVSVVVREPEGRVVAEGREKVTLEPGETERELKPLVVAKPRRWGGRGETALYQVIVRLAGGDEVRQPFGFRTVGFASDGTFLLNGKPYALHGVNRHQERKDKGWALSPADHEEDIALINEIGATALRLAHYQQADYVHELCDRSGLVVWQEVPLVDTVGTAEGFTATSLEQLREMILQGYNHPSLCLWGLFNELDAPWAAVPTGPSVPVIRALRAEAERLDPSRPTVSASWIRDGSALHAVPGQIAFNIYPGWYWGAPDDFGPTVDKLFGEMGRKVGISEYGAGANPWHHGVGGRVPPSKDGHFHPEEWQTHLHERAWWAAKDNPKLWGTYVWAMFDFAIDKRNEGGVPGQNDKGLVTRDRLVKKDAFYFYKANWSREPVLHLAARRARERHEAKTEVEVFSNVGDVELWLNGRSLGRRSPDRIQVCRWDDVTLEPGSNRLEARAGTRVDSVEWVLVK